MKYLSIPVLIKEGIKPDHVDRFCEEIELLVTSFSTLPYGEARLGVYYDVGIYLDKKKVVFETIFSR